MARKRYPSDDLHQILLRVPDGLRDRLKEVAGGNRRSLNSEIVVILERAVFDHLEMKKGTEVSA